MKDFVLTPELITRVLSTVDAGLSSGLGSPSPGNMCVEAAVCFAMGLPHGDNPTCVHSAIRSVKICLNDGNWSSKKTRAAGMRRLAVLQLGTKDNFDSVEFAKKLAIQTVRIILPIALLAANLPTHARACQQVTTIEEAADAARAARAAASYAASAADAASYAARAAASYAASAASAASAARAADAASYAARAASYAAADADKTLGVFATLIEDILIEMNVPAVSYLSLIG